MRLTRVGQSADVTPDGGRVLTYEVDGVPVLSPLELPSSAFRSSLLAPWPNRLADGAWTWEGERLTLPCNEQPLRTALHGLVVDAGFTVVAAAPDRVAFAYDLVPSKGYPFELRLTASYALTVRGLVCALTATNTGVRPAPVALGTHPYLDTRGPVDDVVLTFPARRVLEVDAQWQERARADVDGTPTDLRAGRRLADQVIDACWTDLRRTEEGLASCRLQLPGGDQVTMWGGESSRYVVVYTGDTLAAPHRRRCIAVEPNTAPANALRSGADLDVLAPGQSLRLDWGLTTSW